MDLSSSYSDLSLKSLPPTTYLNAVYTYETSLFCASSKEPYDILLWLCTGTSSHPYVSLLLELVNQITQISPGPFSVIAWKHLILGSPSVPESWSLKSCHITDSSNYITTFFPLESVELLSCNSDHFPLQIVVFSRSLHTPLSQCQYFSELFLSLIQHWVSNAYRRLYHKIKSYPQLNV